MFNFSVLFINVVVVLAHVHDCSAAPVAPSVPDQNLTRKKPI